MKLVMAQLNYTVGDFEGNAAKMAAVVAAHSDADVVAFSELSLSGYYPYDLLLRPDFLDRQETALRKVLAVPTGATVVMGAVARNLGPGKPLSNAAIVAKGGKIEAVYRKQLLPTYNVFDERRHFEPGDGSPVIFEAGGMRIGLLLCEDGWNDGTSDYPVNPVANLAGNTDLILSLNASPSDLGKLARRHAVFGELARKYGVGIVYVNQVGGNDQVVFDGASFAWHPQDGLVKELAYFEEDTGVVEMFKSEGAAPDDLGFVEASVTLDMGPPIQTEGFPCDSEFYRRQLILGLRDYMSKCGFRKAVVGSSGGIDSALTLTLAVEAVGPENVEALTMPSAFSSMGSVSDSETLTSNLGIRLFTHSIAGLYDAFNAAFQSSVGPTGRLTRENLQARIRGTILMEYSNETGSLLLSTGNKSELAVGYCTLYGDTNGGLNLIGDLYKTEVFALARWMNRKAGKNLIPEAIIRKEPSAELSEGQKDSDALPPYPLLDAVLKWYIEGDLDAEAGPFPPAKTVRDVLALVDKAEFKRRQAPPIVKVRPRAFGDGRRLPVAAKRMGSLT